jgi:hypothetical protein
MAQNRTREDFLRFLEYMGDKGLVPVATAASRRATAGKVTEVLSPDEAGDVTLVDLDDVMRRFDNLNPRQYTPGSLQAYKSRMKTALEDFRAYSENPLAFRPTGQSRTKQKINGDKDKTPKVPVRTKTAEQTVTPPSSTLPNISVLPIPLRLGLTVQVAGLPFDLTPAEARKIANIILAHAGSE